MYDLQDANRYKHVHLSVCLLVCPCNIYGKHLRGRINQDISFKFDETLILKTDEIGERIRPQCNLNVEHLCFSKQQKE